MIRVTIELVPKGVESRKRTLATMEIANDDTGDLQTGNYVGTLHAEYTGPEGRKGRVTGYKRRGQSVWSLVGAFLKLWGHTKHSPKLMSKEPMKVGGRYDCPQCGRRHPAGPCSNFRPQFTEEELEDYLKRLKSENQPSQP